MTVHGRPPEADLAALALAALGSMTDSAAAAVWSNDLLAAAVAALRSRPGPNDRRLVTLADALQLTDPELMTVALCLAAERDARAANAVAEAQHPVGRSRVLIGSAAAALAKMGAAPTKLACGRAVTSGLLRLGDEPLALPERSLGIPLPLLAAIEGAPGAWDGVHPLNPAAMPLPEAIHADGATRAKLLAASNRAGLVIRSASPAEAQAVAALVAASLERALARIDGDPPAGLAPWLLAGGFIPLFAAQPGPGERWRAPRLDFYPGPWIAILGLDGAVEAETPPDEWVLPMPDAAERTALWRRSGLGEADAARAAASFRQGAGRIAEAARRAQFQAARRAGDRISWEDVTAGIATGAATLDALARRSVARVPDSALVLPPRLMAGLDRLLDRAKVRSTLADGLGSAVTARYRPGIRALFTGESGTGKTLAAHWLATRLGLPLYRVDLAALTSKWIGETEKNLSSVLGAAEHADVLLFFDEADALFGARTDVSDAHDRFANAQTNFLLQRIEDFDGIVLLATNSRDRFDPAFSRRLDVILDFPMPEASARRALWLAHLGDAHALDAGALDRLALAVDLSGGHIRNIVLAAAAHAKVASHPIRTADVMEAVQEEYGKLGRPPPALAP